MNRYAFFTAFSALFLSVLLIIPTAQAQTTSNAPSSPAPSYLSTSTEAKPKTKNHTADILVPFNATYKAEFSGFGVTAERKLTGSPASWRLDFSAHSMFAKIEEYSRFAQQGQNLEPQHYDYQKSGLGKDRHTALSFEDGGKRIINVYDKSQSIENAPANIQDKISYQLQLAIDIANGKTPLKYAVADGKKIRDYEFEITGKETLNTPMGPIETVKVQRVRGQDAERITNIWFAPQWNYALVKLMQREDNGKSYQITLTKLSINGKEVSVK
ncbi:DUF3108 domain-containing protein [Microbulbifer bruguierae]|uniref:DUF3108 domain-containing protein n=1 Tax=Microbulbifer bruguierae TaxID=3029061 RepID=A0ABY8NH56_9GAMM|nr:DUF3108 domain-containing protein [Microbulbifer bruguierae]WGL17694.1 DUF3108 domain-containing protein [Microbulbifer bruguierae]